MPIQQNYTDPATQATYPASIVAVVDVRVELSAGVVELTLNRYANLAAYQGGATPLGPAFRESLRPDEVGTLQAAFTNDIYNLLIAHPEFADGTLV